jgi:hypothetical protein
MEITEVKGDLGDRLVAIGHIRARGKGSGAETEGPFALVTESSRLCHPAVPRRIRDGGFVGRWELVVLRRFDRTELVFRRVTLRGEAEYVLRGSHALDSLNVIKVSTWARLRRVEGNELLPTSGQLSGIPDISLVPLSIARQPSSICRE